MKNKKNNDEEGIKREECRINGKLKKKKKEMSKEEEMKEST